MMLDCPGRGRDPETGSWDCSLEYENECEECEFFAQFQFPQDLVNTLEVAEETLELLDVIESIGEEPCRSTWS